MTQFRLAIAGQERAFEVSQQGEQLHVSAAPTDENSDATGLTAEVRVLHREGPRLLLEIAWPDGTTERVRVAGARQGDGRRLWVEGRGLAAERVRRRGGGAATQGSLAAAIPAVVSQILVAPGDAVAAGDKLILLESMKMVIPIVSPRDSIVARVLCAPGESVPAGVPLVELADMPIADNNPG